MEKAPFLTELAHAPDGSCAYWIKASDGVRLRVGHFPSEQAKGTVLLFPGRTEYIEKYGKTAADLAASGYTTLAVDWRGQGLADRLLEDPMPGHVHQFSDYQLDVEAVLTAAEELDLPRPYHLLAHSMGGCIGLRSLINGLPVNSAVFSGPMWGIHLTTPMRSAAWVLSWGGKQLGLGHLSVPGSRGESYVLAADFEDNLLTTDREMFDLMRSQLTANPDLELGGPSLRWLNEALQECRELAAQDSPDVPCLTLLGTNERIVDIPRIESRMAKWPNGELVRVTDGEHEVLMDSPDTRDALTKQMVAHYDAHQDTQRLAASG